jgi:hypothetical protein
MSFTGIHAFGGYKLRLPTTEIGVVNNTVCVRLLRYLCDVNVSRKHIPVINLLIFVMVMQEECCSAYCISCFMISLHYMVIFDSITSMFFYFFSSIIY